MNEWTTRNSMAPRTDTNGDGIPDRSLGIYDARVQVYQRNYVTVENIQITQSKGEGLRFYGSTYGYAYNVKVDHTQGWGLIFTLGATNGLAEYCDVSYTSECMNVFGRRVTTCEFGTGALGGTDNADDLTIRYCTVHHAEGEGIGVYKTADNPVVEYKKCYDNIRPNVYIDSVLTPIVRYNLVFGTETPLTMAAEDAGVLE